MMKALYSIIFFGVMVLSNFVSAGGAVEGKIRTILTDYRTAHSPNHGVIFVVFEGSNDRYYLPKDDPLFSYNQSIILAALASKMNIYIQWDNDAISSSFDRKITLIVAGEKPWG